MALTTVGLALIVEQTVASAMTGRGQTQILATGVVLTGGSVALHIGKFVTAQLSGRSSSPPSPPGDAPPGHSSSHKEAGGE